ncbi:MAG TPA: hypothetical protein VKA84_28660, partial [Gemmatimonadaceae bacterium]|nr:hypothetical protein [Gemmatimonadaceae bacterium]
MRHTILRRASSYLLALCFSLGSGGCAPDRTLPTDPERPGSDSTAVVAVADPETARTVGFFLDQWASRPFAAPEFTEATAPTSATATVTVDASSVLAKIPATIFGHNANSWMTRM